MNLYFFFVHLYQLLLNLDSKERTTVITLVIYFITFLNPLHIFKKE